MKEQWYVVPARRAMPARREGETTQRDEAEVEAALLVLTPRAEARRANEDPHTETP
jgi:hypothetical protein